MRKSLHWLGVVTLLIILSSYKKIELFMWHPRGISEICATVKLAEQEGEVVIDGYESSSCHPVDPRFAGQERFLFSALDRGVYVVGAGYDRVRELKRVYVTD